MMLRQRVRSRATGKQGCNCCNGDMCATSGRKKLRRRVRRIEGREWRRDQ